LSEIIFRPKQRSLARATIQAETHLFSTISRLGKTRSPEQDNQSPKMWALRLSEMLEQNQGQVFATFV